MSHRRKSLNKTAKPDLRKVEFVASKLRKLCAKVGLTPHPHLIRWIFDNHKIVQWIRWNDPIWIAKFEKGLNDPEYVAWFEERHKEPAWSEWQESIRKAAKKIAPIAEQAKIFLAIDSIFPRAHMERWRALQAEKEVIADQALSIQNRCEELRPLLEAGTDISTEMDEIDATLTANEARLAAINKEMAPLNREMDEAVARYPEYFTTAAGGTKDREA